MKRIRSREDDETVSLSDVSEDTPIFAKRDGKLAGMIVYEDKGWVIKIGSSWGSTGNYKTREECIRSGYGVGFEFYVEE